MKDEYDFAGAERAKFYRPNARLIPPIHLDPDLLAALSERAEAEGTSLNRLVNILLKKELEAVGAGGKRRG